MSDTTSQIDEFETTKKPIHQQQDLQVISFGLQTASEVIKDKSFNFSKSEFINLKNYLNEIIKTLDKYVT